MSQNILRFSRLLIMDKSRILKFNSYAIPIVGIPSAMYAYGTNNLAFINIQQKYIYDVCGYTRFMVIDDNNTHYCINNSIFYWKWDAIEDYYQLEVNKKYVARTYGYRIPVLGLFPNVYMILKKN